MLRWTSVATLVLLVARPGFPCQPIRYDEWCESVFACANYLSGGQVLTISPSPLFIGHRALSPRGERAGRVRDGVTTVDSAVGYPFTADTSFPSLAPFQGAFRPATPLEPGEYHVGDVVIVVDASADDIPASVSSIGRARIYRVHARSGCGSDCGPSHDYAVLSIETEPDAEGGPLGPYLVTLRNKRTGAIRHQVLKGPRPDTIHSDDAIDLENDTVCVTVAGLGWSGAIGDSIDLGCHKAE